MKRFADDYEIVIEEDENGKEIKKAVYRGSYFEVSLDEPGLKRFKRNSLILFGLMLAFHIGAGFVPSQGMNRFFIILPYVFTFLPLYFLITGILRVPTEKRKYRRDETELSFDRMKTPSTVLLILFCIIVIGEIIFITILSDQPGNQEFLFLVLEVLAAVGGFMIVQYQKQIEISEIKEPQE
jgi:hypothetical protein